MEWNLILESVLTFMCWKEQNEVWLDDLQDDKMYVYTFGSL